MCPFDNLMPEPGGSIHLQNTGKRNQDKCHANDDIRHWNGHKLSGYYSEKVMALNRIPIFGKMNEEYIELLQPLFEFYSCQSGVTVIRQGDQADYLYLILNGKVEVSFKPYDGIPITVSHVGKDGLFGWSAVVGSHTYTSSVTAIEDLETYRIRGSRLRKLCAQYPEAGREILDQLANAVSSRWKNSHEQVKSILVNGIQS